MHTVEVDFDVYKQLTFRRESEEVSYNDVIRTLLGLDRVKKARPEESPYSTTQDWIVRGVHFPVGTEFRADYKGQRFFARVDHGALVFDDGSRYKSPSAAARAITGTQVNGWRFWQCRLPERPDWQALTSIKPSRG